MEPKGTPQPASETDGRRRRGQQRRAEIIAATLRVVQRDGAAGVTHRTVAREATVPTSLTTYYFATLDDLLIAALSSVAEEYADELNAIIADSPDPLGALAEFITASSDTGRTRAMAERELSTLAARRPALRPVANRWRDQVVEIGRMYHSDPTAIQAMVAAADGICAGILLEDDQPDIAQVRAILAFTLREQDTA